MTSKTGTKRDTKKELFLAAAELFAEAGYKGVSMKDIAHKVGIKAASIYNHYAGKEELIDDLLDYYLNRMEVFYTRLAETEIDINDRKDLPRALDKLMLSYDPAEKILMYHLTRIAHHEQFNYQKAADAVIGSGYRKFVAAHAHFFDRLSDLGLITGKAHNAYYGELYARMAVTFAMQFLHPELEPTIEDQTQLGQFLGELIISHQETLRGPAK